MKGVFVHNQIEYRLEVAGETFSQGQHLVCQFTVKNHGSKAQEIPSPGITLARGDLTKMKQRSLEAFTPIASAPAFPACTLEPQQSHTMTWECELPVNALITDRTQTLCFLYGTDLEGMQQGQLPLITLPHKHIQQIVTIFESTFQCIVKGLKFAEGKVNYKMKPSSAKRLSLVDELNLSFHFEEAALILEYLFKVKKLQATATSVGVKKGTQRVTQRLEAENYLLAADVVHNRCIESTISEALETVSVGLKANES